MNGFFILTLTLATSGVAYLAVMRKQGVSQLGVGVRRTLQTIGMAVLFYGANILVTLILIIGLRGMGVFVSIYAGTDPLLAGLSIVQALLFQHWRYAAFDAEQ